ncbi:MAG TPA: ABC transporter permease [Streptosporangiaceae bacterium]|nr:ABC transporter permease [Streptosporangiaceae bacterium]
MAGAMLEGALAAAQELRGEEAGAARGGAGLARNLGIKIGSAIVTLFFVLVFNFFLFRVLPADPARNLARGTTLTATQMAAINKTYGLGLPLPAQFWNYLVQTFHGNLGISFEYHIGVSQVIGSALWPTILLVGTSTVLSTVIGVWIGIRGGWNRGSTFDKTSTAINNTLYAMPDFWLGMVLLIVFASKWFIFPEGGMHSFGGGGTGLAGINDLLWHLTLPCIVLTLVYLAEYSLVMRSSLIDELGSDYLLTARAKGLRDAMVRRRHAVPNALLPSITLIMLNLGFVISGAITTETVFSWPGLGLLSYNALNFPDYPVLEGAFLLFSAAVIAANLIADLLLTVLDPRVRQA